MARKQFLRDRGNFCYRLAKYSGKVEGKFRVLVMSNFRQCLVAMGFFSQFGSGVFGSWVFQVYFQSVVTFLH